MKFTIILFLTALSLGLLAQDFSMDKVVTKQQQDGSIDYYTHFSFKGDTANLRKVVRDVFAYTELTEAIEVVKLIEKTSNTISYYMLYDLPWPLDNRQSNSFSKISYEQGKMILYTKPYPKAFDSKVDAIWMDNFFEKWIITQKADYTILVDVTGKMDLKGNLPSWLVESFIPNELKRSYEGIITRSKK